MATGKAAGVAVRHGHTFGGSDRLASAVRIMPQNYDPEAATNGQLAHRPGERPAVPLGWSGSYGTGALESSTPDGSPWLAAERDD